MKPLGILLALLLASALSLQAKWSPLTRDALIQNADAIVIAEYVNFQPVQKDHGFYDQLGSFTLEKSLKGKVDKQVQVYGCSMAICAPLISFGDLKLGRYLIFLSRREFGWTDCSAFIQPITDGKVLWFKNNQDLEKVPTPLDEVLRQIQAGQGSKA